jgi:DNA-binding MarR family transcriptional regulator
MPAQALGHLAAAGIARAKKENAKSVSHLNGLFLTLLGIRPAASVADFIFDGIQCVAMNNPSIYNLQRSLVDTRRWREVLRSFVHQFGGKMTTNQLLVLTTITLKHFADEECTVQSLAEEEEICQQTVSGCVKRLEAHGLIETKPCQRDGRVRFLRLTDKAVALRAHAHLDINSKHLEAI